MARGQKGTRQGKPGRPRIAAAVGTAGAGSSKGLAAKIEAAMGQAAQKALSDGADVEGQRRAMQAARRETVEQHAKDEARAAEEAQRRTAKSE